MRLAPIVDRPAKASYDVVIIGGAMIGSAIAWNLSADPTFDGSVLVVERDPTYAFSGTSRTNSCMRQQFSTEVNIRISQYGAEFLKNFRELLGGDPEIPDIFLHSYGYLYLADHLDFVDELERNQQLQASLGAGTRIMSPAEIAAAYPFYNVDDILCGSHNTVDEGYFDGTTMFDWFRRMARRNGVEYITAEVTGVDRRPDRVDAVSLATGEHVSCGTVVNAAGTRAGQVAAFAGIDLPVEPRRRYTYIFDSQEPIDGVLPLTIDPSGVHLRDDGAYFLAGCPPRDDETVDHDDFSFEGDPWEDRIWPAIANRVPAFERAKVIQKWVGHYAFNTVDHNAVIGPHHEATNFVFACGFSGHGFQQAPATGRGVAELISHGRFRTLDLSPLGYERIAAGRRFEETAII